MGVGFATLEIILCKTGFGHPAGRSVEPVVQILPKLLDSSGLIKLAQRNARSDSRGNITTFFAKDDGNGNTGGVKRTIFQQGVEQTFELKLWKVKEES